MFSEGDHTQNGVSEYMVFYNLINCPQTGMANRFVGHPASTGNFDKLEATYSLKRLFRYEFINGHDEEQKYCTLS